METSIDLTPHQSRISGKIASLRSRCTRFCEAPPAGFAEVERYGQIMGPVVERQPGKATATACAAGGDMHTLIVGTPDTEAQKVLALADPGALHAALRKRHSPALPPPAALARPSRH